jgi:hypothetical protein
MVESRESDGHESESEREERARRDGERRKLRAADSTETERAREK